MSVLSYRGVGVAYPDAPPVLAEMDLEVSDGEILLLVGSSGAGKSTVLRCANGLVPHASGGRFSGDVVVGGRSTRQSRPRDLADVVGFVHQDPESQFVVDHVEADVAFVLENLGTDPAVMRRRVEEALDALGIAHLRDRSPATLSGGEQQRVAIAGALAAAPAVLVLDEPTSELDPQGAEDVLSAIARLNADLGTTILIAEHRLERAGVMADRAAILRRRNGGPARLDAVGPPATTLVDYDGAPTVTHLGALLGWDPLPLTVRAARAHVTNEPPLSRSEATDPPVAGERLCSATALEVARGGHTVVRVDRFELAEGEVVALLGRNGSGKSTLLQALAGLLPAERGRVRRETRISYVPQDPGTMLFRPTVRAELRETLRLLGREDDATDPAIDHWLGTLGLGDLAGRHPRTLSSGERQRAAIAAVGVGGATVLLLDEPTRGMDAESRTALEHAIRGHAGAGGAVVLATHDVELAARVATRAVVLGDGDVVAAGPAREVLAGSLFAPQTLRVLPPFLTVDEVATALARRRR